MLTTLKITFGALNSNTSSPLLWIIHKTVTFLFYFFFVFWWKVVPLKTDHDEFCKGSSEYLDVMLWATKTKFHSPALYWKVAKTLSHKTETVSLDRFHNVNAIFFNLGEQALVPYMTSCEHICVRLCFYTTLGDSVCLCLWWLLFHTSVFIETSSAAVSPFLFLSLAPEHCSHKHVLPSSCLSETLSYCPSVCWLRMVI